MNNEHNWIDNHDCSYVDCFCEYCTRCGANMYSKDADNPCAVNTKMQKLIDTKLLIELLEALPKCQRFASWSEEKCTKRAEYVCYDAAGDPVITCDEHKFVGGMVGDDHPGKLKYAKAIRELEKILEND